MLTKEEEEIVSNYVDEYVDGLRMDVVVLDGVRVIKAQTASKIVVVDKEFLIDDSREYDVILRNPVEDYFFIPKEIDYYETQIDLEFDRKDGFKITNFVDSGVIDADTVSIDDPRISDSCLSNLASQMCFDDRYQQLFPEVKHVVDEFLNDDTSKELERIKKRIEPFIRSKGSNQL